MEIKKPVFIVVILGVIVLASIAVVVLLPTDSLTQTNKSQKQKPLTAQIKKVDESKLPNKFPDNLPIENGVKITQNFNATETDGRYNATREFESKKTLAENISIYTQYLKANKWKIKSTVNQPTLKMVMGLKAKQQLQIVAAENPTTKAVVVTITLTEFK